MADTEEANFQPSDALAICPDGHRCANGAVCVERENDENNYMCDCQEANGDNAYAGLYCEHHATTYCVDDAAEVMGIPSKTTFCTNGGECAVTVDPNENHQHYACVCPPNYVGSHCQFVAGTISQEDLMAEMAQIQGTNLPRKGSSKPVLPALIGLCVAAMLVLAALVLIKKFYLDKRQPSAKEVRTVTEDLALETDGSSSFSPREGSLPTVEEMKGNGEDMAPTPRVTEDDEPAEVI